MIDSHTHLYFPEYGTEIENIVRLSQASGVSHFILPNVDEESLGYMKSFHSKFPLVTSMAMGLHPTEVKENWQDFLQKVEEELKTGEYVAVGEVGMDLYWDKTYIEEQKEAFKQQLILAEKYNLPVIIHCREAFEETMEVIENVNPSVDLIFHSFTGTKENVDRIRKSCNPYFGINGVITYKNANELRDSLPIIGIEKIVLETDSPYLTPVPYRGKRNNSSYLCHIRDKVAEVLGLSIEEVEEITDKNTQHIFRI